MLTLLAALVLSNPDTTTDVGPFPMPWVTTSGDTPCLMIVPGHWICPDGFQPPSGVEGP
jgi:hypothetical protein